jgi:RNA polymerase sigma-70 factor (ECF subfamily)
MATCEHNLPEHELMLRVQAGDRDAFGVLVSQFMQRAYFGALGLVGSHDDALDLSQEAFARAFKARSRIDPQRPFYTWYYQILRRLCFNLMRDGKTRKTRLDEAGPWLLLQAENRGPQQPELQMETEQMQQETRRAIEDLPGTEREMIVLREMQGLSYKEISELLEIPTGTVMSRLYKARKRLATQLVSLR